MADLEADGMEAPLLSNVTKVAMTMTPQYAWELVSKNRDQLVLNAQMILTALAIIYVGAHGALRRPPSAAPRRRRDGKKKDGSDGSEDGFTEGFTASDAILLPIMAGTVLVGLYYLIQWLNDPDLLSKFLRFYLSAASLVSLGKLLADALHFVTGLVFPNVWADMSGRLFRVDPLGRRQLLRVAEEAEEAVDRGDQAHRRGGDREGDQEEGQWEADAARVLPVPDLLSFLGFFGLLNDRLWGLRHLLKERWTVRVGLHGVGEEKIPITLNGVFGVVFAASVAVGYHFTNSPLLSNVMGLGMSYGSFMLLSPTSFPIGTMVLGGLFIYDIVMVFYTPFMVTVATTIDAPIKLVFQEKGRASLLGLGDIVVPGIFICLSLRFDLWQHYQRQAKRVPTELRTELAVSADTSSDPASASTTTTATSPSPPSGVQYHIDTKDLEVKAEYIDPQGRWGDRLWTLVLRGPPTPGLRAAAFPKPYFIASMVAYTVGMLLTVSMLVIFNQGQPALLYLVPCVTGSVWLMGAARGELLDVWKYTEDGSLDTKDSVVEVDVEGNVIPAKSAEGEDGEDKVHGLDGAAEKGEDNKGKKTKVGREGYDVFRFVISAPGCEDIEEIDF